jgi:hypothetical protein
MTLVTNKSESERTKKIKSKTIYANYLATQTKFQGGCVQIPPPIQSGSGASNQASVSTELLSGAVYTTSAEAAVIILQSRCTVTTNAPKVPSAPTNVTGVSGITRAVILSWTAPDYEGASPIILYTATSSPEGITATSDTTSVTVTGLTNNVPYTFTVFASNAEGNSLESSPSDEIIPTNNS